MSSATATGIESAHSDSMQFNQSVGYTAVELLTVIAISSVLMVLTAPNISHALNESHAATTARALHLDLYFARSSAIARRAHIVVCAADKDQCGDNRDWSQGWWVFVDTNRNRKLDANETRLRRGQPVRGRSRIRQGQAQQGRTIRFKPGGGAWPSTTFSVCASNKEKSARAVVIYYTGRVRISANRPNRRAVDCGWFQA